QPATGVTAASTGRGKVTVSWVPSTDTGGTYLVKQVVEVGGRKIDVAPDATSLEVTGVVPGQRAVKVRAVNPVARSPWATTSVAVPAYPSVSAPAKVRKGTTVTITLRGLLPGERPVVTIDPAKGATVTRRPAVSAAGTASLRWTVKSRTRVVAVSGGVRSDPRVIRLP
ncbi:MAG TPA: fibronectin type III domain-containing protein, partial [Candidatus Nanopelagicales bacterium]|nr:fibronectin type III domain-containing protein [Candidatus Nanopelagicales bacterium]